MTGATERVALTVLESSWPLQCCRCCGLASECGDLPGRMGVFASFRTSLVVGKLGNISDLQLGYLWDCPSLATLTHSDWPGTKRVAVGLASTVSTGVGHVSRASFGFLKLSSNGMRQKQPTEERSWCRAGARHSICPSSYPSSQPPTRGSANGVTVTWACRRAEPTSDSRNERWWSLLFQVLRSSKRQQLPKT